MNPLKIANIMADAADKKSKAKTPGTKSPKQVAAAKEQEKAKGKTSPKQIKGAMQDADGDSDGTPMPPMKK